MAVALRQPTFKNPLPKMIKTFRKYVVAFAMGVWAFGESAGRARAAAELHRQGFYEEAKRLMLESK